MNDFSDFLLWEKNSRDTIDFKKIYIDITGDLIAGLLLSQIIYWNLPDQNGKSKLKVYKQNKYWLAKQRNDWWEEIRITEKQYDRAIKILKEKQIVEVENTMFDGKRTPHIYLNQKMLIKLLKEQINLQKQGTSTVLPKGQYRCSLKGKTGVNQKVRPITENTTESTTKTKALYIISNDDPFIDFYLKTFEHHFSRKHMRVSQKNLEYIHEVISKLKSCDIEFDEWCEKVREYFSTLPTTNNGSVLAFLKASKRIFDINYSRAG